ncbi:MAG: LPS-assembly protein LptD [Gammaproteobacteria bacterium]
MPRLLALMIASLAAVPLWAAPVCPVPEPMDLEPPDESGPIEVSADRADVTADGDSVFSGGVVLRRGNQRLETEGATWDRDAGRIVAIEGARYAQPGIEIESDRLEYLPAEGTALLSGNRYRLPAQPASGGAETIRARDNGRVRMEEVTYTTCPDEEPDWLLRIDTMRLDTRDEVGEATGVKLRFFDTPIVYLPYLTFPLSDRRKSGFLTPEFGQSSRSGLEIRAPYYFNLAPDYDYLLTPVLMTDRGLKLENEFRYLTPESSSKVQLHYLHRDSGTKLYDSRSWFNLSHLTRLENGWRFTAQVEDVSDTDYFQDLGESPQTTSRTHVQRLLQADYAGQTWRMTVRAQNFRILDLEIPEEERPYARLPQAVAEGIWLDGPLGLDWRMLTEAASFVREVGPEGARAVLEPEVSLPLEAPGFFLRPSARMRMVQYLLTAPSPGQDDTLGYAAPILSVDSGLRFERPARSGRVTQTLEPRLLYAYIPYRDQDALPLFDSGRPDFNYVQLFRPNRYLGADRLGDTNQLSFGITTRLLESASGREFLTAAIGKAWYFEDPRVTLPDESLETAGSSPIVLELGLRLFNYWNADVGYQWDNVTDSTQLAQFRLQYQPASNRVVNLAYRYRPGLLEDLAFSMGWPLSQRWSFVTALEYSLRDSTTVDSVLGVQYESCCWAMRFSASEQISRRDGSKDTTIRLQLELKGLGGQSARRRYESDILGYSAFE